MPSLFDSFTIRGVTLRNRIVVSPMCQYSCTDGLATDWHLVHLGSRAVGGASAIFVEATAVEARGRISPQDMGLWNDAQIEPLARISKFVESQGAVPGIQLAHAGRKASTQRPWDGHAGVSDSDGGWEPIAPSAIPFSDEYRKPRAMTLEDIATVRRAFVASAKRAVTAGFKIIELHFAHGYLGHEFLSPLSNSRTDQYGGSLENRMRFCIETARDVRAAIPESMPLFARLSCTDWVDGGWDLEQSIALSRELKSQGVDLIDASSGAIVPHAKIPVGPNYQVPFADAIRKQANIPTAAVGMITEPQQADDIITKGQADLIFLARQMLRDPYWPIHAARQLNRDIAIPLQYGRAL